MCGIAGIINNQFSENLKFSENAGPAIQRMTNAMAHRGPDAAGHFTNGDVALGHRRLSIIDLSAESNQPFWDATGRYVIVFNGEIYNYKEVQGKLPDYPFRTQGDTEAVLAAYIRWGESCLEHFFGMFAFAIWDTQTQRLFMARDRMGIKPFYYFQNEKNFLFASEIRSLLASGLIDKRLNKRSLHEYLTYQTVHAPNTMVEGLFQLKPGESAILEKGVFTKKTYWQLGVNGRQNGGMEDYGTVKKNVRRLMFEAVERRLVSDVPLGAFLSGGIDSTAVVALMAEAAGRQVDTFSVVFEEPKFDESQYSNLVAKLYKTNHHPVLLKPTDFLDALPDALRAMDSPSGDGVNTFVVSKVTKAAGVTVALSGLGGDELFAGYSLFGHYWQLNRVPNFFWKIPRPLRMGGAALGNLFLKSHQKARVTEIASARSAAIADVYPAFRKLLTDNELGEMHLNGSANGNGKYDAVQELIKSQAGINELPLLSQLTVADISTYTQNVLLKDTDQMSMAHALEVRVPFFDHALVEYVVQVPDRFKYPDYAKKLLVESLKPLVPDEVVFREKKGFDLPWKVWLKNELRELCESKLKKLGERGLVPEKLLNSLWNDFSQGKNDNLWSRIWIFVVLEDWLEKNFD